MQRPDLNEIPLKSIFDKPEVIITMGSRQWDSFLQTNYDLGNILLEVNCDEIPVRAYRKVDA